MDPQDYVNCNFSDVGQDHMLYNCCHNQVSKNSLGVQRREVLTLVWFGDRGFSVIRWYWAPRSTVPPFPHSTNMVTSLVNHCGTPGLEIKIFGEKNTDKEAIRSKVTLT